MITIGEILWKTIENDMMWKIAEHRKWARARPLPNKLPSTMYECVYMLARPSSRLGYHDLVWTQSNVVCTYTQKETIIVVRAYTKQNQKNVPPEIFINSDFVFRCLCGMKHRVVG